MRRAGAAPRRAVDRSRCAPAASASVVAGLALTGCSTSSYTCVNDRCTFKANGSATTTLGDDDRVGSTGRRELRIAVDDLRDGSVEVSVQGQRRTVRRGETVTFERARVTAVKATAGKVELRILR
ncbi:hypothetical protein [Patulibacter minatonensis]|uniref:hypothetical protein n=1 Tax=Patulibacter minatonensis TaxID=298163 RepID=UPI0004786C0F|nr:hypothetical protein [Patulibacter minatonensis]